MVDPAGGFAARPIEARQAARRFVGVDGVCEHGWSGLPAPHFGEDTADEHLLQRRRT
jgi:hypothetical protein